MKTLEFKQAESFTLPLVKRFYKQNGMRAQAPKSDLIYIARLNGHIVAALRLHPVGNNYLLRSMCVDTRQRQQGIGTALLSYCQKALCEINCYSFPFEYLQNFYGQANFKPCKIESTPHDIALKFTRYLENGKKICLMKHHPD